MSWRPEQPSGQGETGPRQDRPPVWDPATQSWTPRGSQPEVVPETGAAGPAGGQVWDPSSQQWVAPGAPLPGSWPPMAQRAYRGSNLGLPPEGVNSIAGIGRRIWARLVDSVILVLGIIAIALVAFISLGDPADAQRATLLFFLPGWVFYEVGMLAAKGGTVGKLALGIRVARVADGENPSFGSAFLRWLLMNIPYVSILVVIWALWDGNSQGLHDKAANTVVVRSR
ncbi:MAG: RDD family protein [Actinomycetota bacterium]